MDLTERRQQYRYSITVPANMTMGRGKDSRVLELRTRDVSSAGAFLETLESIYVGSGVRIELFIEPKTLLEIIQAHRGARIRVSGRVVRSTQEGVAVQFEKGFRILPMRDQEEN